MFITAIILSLLTAFLLLKSGMHSSNLVENRVIRRLVIGGCAVAGILGGILVFETLWPAEPTAEGDLKSVNDAIVVEDGGEGVLYLECKMVDEEKRTGIAVNMRIAVEGGDEKQTLESAFQTGNSSDDMENPEIERMGINHSVRSVADGARFRLSQLGGDGTVYVHATYRPARFPFLWVFLVFCIFGLFAIAYEGAAPLRSQRSFLSVTFITAAWFIWLCEGGMSIDDSIGTIWMRFAYAMAIGAVLGSLLPVMAGWMLPELEPPARESEEDVEDVEEDGEDEEDRDAP